ncbi:antibiotic biosynthesis monooxygenase [Vibrio rotiferianus]|uniref:Antibiotic biosynthesis monooxygenase n=1 Tax=Vibrio rotiferianus TaxID=190895 RepID=A0A510I7B4_9VIBR|nr:putative quinol monooxygenase [Vibrio rotiferianus]BBL89427.1 antibiotic biosynthesis monooxygenase [Vibrio rotiferianus]
MIHLTAAFYAKTDSISQLKQALEGMLEPTRNEPGCLRYQLFQDKNDPSQFLFQEQFADQAAFDQHCKTEHFQTLLASLDGLLLSEPKLTFYEEL